MTVEEAWASIKSSTVWKNASADPEIAWANFSRLNAAAASWLFAFAAHIYGGGSPSSFPGAPVGVTGTAYGKGMRELVGRKLVMLCPTGEPAPPPPPPLPPPTRAARNGAVIKIAENGAPDFLRAAGVNVVCMDYDRPANWQDFAFSQPGQRWGGFTRGLFYVSRNDPTASEINDVKTIAKQQNCKLVMFDIEAHKVGMGGQMSWTDHLATLARAAFPVDGGIEIGTVTFGRDQDTSVVNHTAMRRFDWAIFETYDGDGVTQGVYETVAKVNAQGWKPADVMYGTKSLGSEMPQTAPLRAVGAVRDAWLWAADDGPSREALASGLRF